MLAPVNVVPLIETLVASVLNVPKLEVVPCVIFLIR